ncbi:Uncharacterised protein [Vibrio cholerae]|nr:Uncharacterised protein [Vibrio cholerae]
MDKLREFREYAVKPLRSGHEKSRSVERQPRLQPEL